jgi:hypothetical protein
MRKRGCVFCSASGVWAMIWLAASVPSALQAGQFTLKGMTPSRGSTSKEYRAPQPHWTLIVILD